MLLVQRDQPLPILASICGSALAFRRVSTFLFLALTLLSSSSFAKAGAAIHWQIDEGLASHETIERLTKRYPNLDAANHRQNLLRDLARMEPLAQLHLYYSPSLGLWIIKGRRAAVIKAVEFDLTTRTFRSALENLSLATIGQVDAPEVEQKLLSAIAHLMMRRGFPEAKITLSKEPTGDDVKYKILLREGYPCLIANVEVGFTLPPRIRPRIRTGDICDMDEIEQAVVSLERELQDFGYNQVRLNPLRRNYDATSNAASFAITGSLGRRIRYEIVETGKRFGLRDLFSDDELSTIDPNIIGPDAVRSELVRRYQGRGYMDVVVDEPTINQDVHDLSIYTYRVTPGVLYQLQDVQFEGVTVFSREELFAILNLDAGWQRTRPLNINNIRTGIDQLKARYQTAGFWSVVVREPRITRSRESGQAQLVLTVSEGAQRVLAEHILTINGDSILTEDEIKEKFTLKQNEPLDRNALADFERDVRGFFLLHGYLYVAIKIELDEKVFLRQVPINVLTTIDVGPRVRIGDIFISGLIDTDKKVVLRELTFSTNDWYNPEEIDRSRRALLSLGLFRTVQIAPLNLDAFNVNPDVLDLNIQLREGRPGNVSFGPGWSLFRGRRFTAEGSYNNIGGTGRQVFLRGSISEEAHQLAIGNDTLLGRSASIGYLEPYIFNLPVNGIVSLSHRAQADRFWILSYAGELALSHRLRRVLEGSVLTLFYNQKINATRATESQQAANIATDTIRIGRVGLRYTLDRRNDMSWPTAGYFLQGEASRARFDFGGDLAFYYWDIENSHYFQLSQNTVFAVGGTLSAFHDIQRQGSKDNILPPGELLHLEGPKVVRGFRERTLSPTVRFFEQDLGEGRGTQTEDDVPLGGTHRALFRTELRYQIVEKTFATTGFIDSGSTFFDDKELEGYRRESFIVDNSPYDFTDLITDPKTLWQRHYVSYGLAFNYLTPVGSINLAYGLPWKRCPLPDNKCELPRGKSGKHWYFNGQVHINVGATF